MSTALRILVTGAGSVVGQGIAKALRISGLDYRLIMADIGPLNAGLFRSDEAVILPAVEAAGALEGIVDVLRQREVHVLFLGSEFDIAFYAAHREEIERRSGATVVVSPPETIALANDKLCTARFLAQHGWPAPMSVDASDPDAACQEAERMGFPVILKPRSGTSSRHVHIVRTSSELRHLLPLVPSPMVQELLAHSNASSLGSEYTCSIFKDPTGQILGPIIARWRLRGGSSWIVEVCHRPDFVPLLHDIGQALNIVGSLNVQLIETADGPVPFEFNARFSGTTAIRAHFGFNEPEMAVRACRLGERLPHPTIRPGLCLRYEEEIFLDGLSASSDLLQHRGIVHPWF